METIRSDDESALDRAADSLRDGLRAERANEASLLADLRAESDRQDADIEAALCALAAQAQELNMGY